MRQTQGKARMREQREAKMETQGELGRERERWAVSNGKREKQREQQRKPGRRQR